MKAFGCKKAVRVLHLEDNENDRLLVEEMVRADGLDCEFTAVQTRVDLETALHQGGYDVIISDYSMPSFDGLSGLAIAHELSPKTPFIFFSGTIGEESAVRSLKNGAVDYVIKQRPHRLVPAMRQALRNAEQHAQLQQLEEQLLRSQRLESLGVLISGIAHDLNNALTPVLIGIDMLRASPVEKENILKTMQSSAQRGADMVKQVLAFARGGDTKKSLIYANPLVKEMGKIVADTFPKNIECQVKVSGESWPVSGIPTQLYQVLMNLCVNGRDAMPEGGTLTLATENVCLDETLAVRHQDVKPGNYVCVSVKDTGTGISAEQMEKIFEPFFTTKEPGKGTGLGLSTSLNIIKNHDGFVDVQSEVGRGTEFKFYLPAMIETFPAVTPEEPSLPMGSGECVLVVDDEAIALLIARTALENYGYRVLTAASGLEAITCLTEKRDAVDAVIIDSVMPLMGGAATATALRRINPDVKIVFAGDSEKDAEEVPGRVKMGALISKPFTVEKLLAGLHKVLAKNKN
ncbi:MAG TPA: response regulator [Verrucomicrobiae bacterium]|jgi:signal transduction histidine kinase